jgi:phospholipid transport system substrate-binding protein
MNRLLRHAAEVFLSLSFTFSTAAFAQVIPPDVLVRQMTQEITTAMQNDPDIVRGDAKKAAALIEQKLSPHIAFEHVTALAVGRNWRNATPAQQAALTEEFRKLLLRVYAGTLASYRSARIDQKFMTMPAGATNVNVRLEITQYGAAPVAIIISMELMPDGWKMYDVTVDGISLVTTFREGFSGEIKRSGIDGLIAALRKKNEDYARR